MSVSCKCLAAPTPRIVNETGDGSREASRELLPGREKDFKMFKKILLSAVLTFALSASTAWAQGCDSGCAGGGCGGAVVGGGAGGGCSGGGCDGGYAGGPAMGGCDGGGCGGAVGQDYFGGNAGCGDCGGGCGGGCCKYTRVFGGLNIIDDISDQAGLINFEDGWGAGFALGRRNGNRRAEVELSYRHNSFNTAADDGNITQTSNMYNMLFDLNFIRINDAQFYAGGGIGLTYADVHVVSLATEAFDTGFSYQGIAGFSKQLRNGARGFAEYRYLSSDFNFGGGDVTVNNHSAFMGIELSR